MYMSIYNVLSSNLEIIMGKIDEILNEYLDRLSNIDLRYGLLGIGSKKNKIIINTALAGDLIISFIYRQLQYGYPSCDPIIRVNKDNYERSKKAKLEFLYITASALDEIFSSIVTKRELLKSVLSSIIKDYNKFALLESIKVYLNWFIETHQDKDKVKIILRKFETINDDYIISLIEGVIERIKKKDKSIDELINAKLKIGGIDEYINKAIREMDTEKLLEIAIVSMAFDGFTWLKALIYELIALYVYIANDYRIMPFGPMQHVIEGGFSWSVTLGDFIDPMTGSLIDVKSSIYAIKAKSLIRLVFELRIPIQIAIPHYIKNDKSTDYSIIYLSIYQPKYRGKRELEFKLINRMKGIVPGYLLEIRPRIKSLSSLNKTVFIRSF